MDITRFIVTQRDKALLVGDYGSYRKQLSRRLLVVRKKLNYSTKGRKYTAKNAVSADDIARNHEFVDLLLLSAERAWAFAMHMKTTNVPDSGAQGTTGSTRKHIISRFQRASTFAGHLVALLQEKDKGDASAGPVLEARAYQQSLQGALNFEKKAWEQSLHSYSESRLLYTALAQQLEKKQDDLFKDLLASTIDPSIRYAAYQLKLPRTISIESIVARYVSQATSEYTRKILASNPDLVQEPGAQARKNADGDPQDMPKTISWRSRTVNLEDATTAQALAALAAGEAKLSSFLSENVDAHRKAKAAAYDDVLIPSQDAVDATKTAIDELTAEGVPQGDPRMQSLQITRTAVNYNLVEWRIGRNRVLCGGQDGAKFEPEPVKKPKKPRADGKPRPPEAESKGRQLARLKERVVLYDSTLQSLESVKELPGVAADQAFVHELEAKKAYFSALRCLAIARSHTIQDSKKNALALLARALDLSRRPPPQSSTARSGTGPVPRLEIQSDQSKSLSDLLERLVLQHRAFVELENLDKANSQSNNFKPPPMIERLDVYPPEGVDLTNLVTYPPKIQPVPVKPIFLDVAWNYIDYPGRPKKGSTDAMERKVDEAAPAQEPKKEAKKGWFGFGR
ncbi:MAG: hypothetical protein Q9222_007471 [Ikaeria aurantiellina]